MSDWEEILKRLLRRGKVSTAAVVNAAGSTLATVPDIQVTAQEGEAIVKAVTSDYPCTFKMEFAGECFTCFHKDEHTMVGSAEDRVLVAVSCQGGVMVGLADSHSPGSCLYEVTEFNNALRRKSEKKRRSQKNVRKVIV